MGPTVHFDCCGEDKNVLSFPVSKPGPPSYRSGVILLISIQFLFIDLLTSPAEWPIIKVKVFRYKPEVALGVPGG